MNYIEQINGFWNKSEESDITGLDIAVYMSLLKYCNRLNWLNPFVCHWDIVCQTSKVSKNAYYKSLERLTDLGFIKAEKGIKNTTKKPKIFILDLTNNKGIIREQRGNKEGIEREQQGNLYKHLNNLTDKQINIILNFYDSLSESDLSLKIKEINTEGNNKPPTAKQKPFTSLSEEEFKFSLVEFVDEFGKKTVREFFDYWSEMSPSGKMKFQLNKTWDSKKRLTTWKRNEGKFGNDEAYKPQPKVIHGPWNV